MFKTLAGSNCSVLQTVLGSRLEHTILKLLHRYSQVNPALAGAPDAHVAALDISFTASGPATGPAGRRRRLSAVGCGALLPVSLIAYNDYSCADYAALLTDYAAPMTGGGMPGAMTAGTNGSAIAAGANCTGGVRRVQQAAATVDVPLGGIAAALANASDFHDFTSLVSYICMLYCRLDCLLTFEAALLWKVALGQPAPKDETHHPALP